MGLLVNSSLKLPIEILEYHSGQSLYWLIPSRPLLFKLRDDPTDYFPLLPWSEIYELSIDGLLKLWTEFSIWQLQIDNTFKELFFLC